VKWFFCLDEYGARREIGAWAELAVASARRSTTLEPVCLFDGPLEDEFVQRLKKLDVRVLPMQSRLSSAIELAHARVGYPIHAKGAFLRAEVPSLVGTDEFAFYTDCDVVFLSDPKLSTLKPKVFSAGPRQDLFDTDQFNSGVLFFNVKGFKAIEGDFFRFAEKNLGPFLPGVDEPIFNAFFRDVFDPLPVGLNWRPFFGLNETASILHFHGPKLGHLVQYVTEGPDATWGLYSDALTRLIGANLPAYFGYCTWLADTFELPPVLDVLISQFLNAYPRFRDQAAERFGSATLRRHRDAAVHRAALTRRGEELIRTLAACEFDGFQLVDYRFEGKAVSYPNLLVELFPELGVGFLLSAEVEYDDGTREELRDLEFRDCIHSEAVPGRPLLSLSDYARVVITPTALADRSRVRAITLRCRESMREQSRGTFADSKGLFFAENRTLPLRTVL
jgi:hypothetical protein